MVNSQPRPSKTIATLPMCCKSAAHCFKHDEGNVPRPITVFVAVIAKTSELMRPKSHPSGVVLKHCCCRIVTEKSKSSDRTLPYLEVANIIFVVVFAIFCNGHFLSNYP